MSITFGNSGYDTDQASGTTSIDNNGDYLVVAINSTSDDITAVSYGGVAMTQLGSTSTTSWSGRFHSVWYLLNPSAGANNLVTTGGANWQFIWFSASGVDSINAESDSGDQPSSNPTSTITTTISSAYHIAIGQLQGSTPTAGANTTLIVEGVGGGFFAFRSTSEVTPAGSSTLNITAGAGGWRLRGFALNPPAAAAAPKSSLLLSV